LKQMGAHIQVYSECLGSKQCRFGRENFFHSAVIQGPIALEAADIEVPDLRGGFSYLIAALAARGESVISGIDIINRGYEHFMQKLRALGAQVEKL
ncbi:MAG: UDP-N-acetylglucosamine 1-carboxyvinyltransferase, partial [Arcanobacterium sp.]|nr:UDP-N-acetylglucosamine 1-carboxyvinyltransferase [Arcanobacterium sp.]